VVAPSWWMQGFSHGCKLAVIDAQGAVLACTTVRPFASKRGSAEVRPEGWQPLRSAFYRLRVLRLHYASDAARVLQHCVARRTAIQTIADLLRTHRVSAVRRPHRVGLPALQERLASAPTGGLGR
jgi:hypothetical protein